MRIVLCMTKSLVLADSEVLIRNHWHSRAAEYPQQHHLLPTGHRSSAKQQRINALE